MPTSWRANVDARHKLIRHDRVTTANRTAGLSQRTKARDKTIKRRRSCVEPVFARLQQQGGKAVRAIGLARNELALAIKCGVWRG